MRALRQYLSLAFFKMIERIGANDVFIARTAFQERRNATAIYFDRNVPLARFELCNIPERVLGSGFEVRFVSGRLELPVTLRDVGFSRLSRRIHRAFRASPHFSLVEHRRPFFLVSFLETSS